jgi:hypothetical protein
VLRESVLLLALEFVVSAIVVVVPYCSNYDSNSFVYGLVAAIVFVDNAAVDVAPVLGMDSGCCCCCVVEVSFLVKLDCRMANRFLVTPLFVPAEAGVTFFFFPLAVVVAVVAVVAVNVSTAVAGGEPPGGTSVWL